MKELSVTKRVVFWLRLICLIGLLTLALGEAVVRLLGEEDEHGTFVFGEQRIPPYRLSGEVYAEMIDRYRAEGSIFAYDSLLGWAYSARVSDHQSADQAGSQLGQGAEAQPDERLTIVLLGDSFTQGPEVALAAKWRSILEARLNSAGLPADVINLAVGGYGIDQALLRWTHNGRSLAPDVVILGLQPENIKRNLNIFRPFYVLGTSFYFTKPRLVLERDSLLIKNVPTIPLSELPDFVDGFDRHPLAAYEAFRDPDLYADRFWMQSKLLATIWTLWGSRVLGLEAHPDSMFYAVGTEAYDLGLAIIEELARDVSAHGADFIVLHLPSPRHHVIPYARGTPRAYEELLAEAKGRYLVVDPFDALVQAVREGDGADIVMPGGHYSVAANRLVADELVAFVLKRYGALAEGGR